MSEQYYMLFVISEKEIADDSYDNIWCSDLWDNWKIMHIIEIIFVGFKF